MKKIFAFLIAPAFGVGAMLAQSSAPAPGAGGAFTPNMGAPGPAIPAWGSPWGGGWSSSPSVIVNAAPYGPGWSDSGTTSVVGVGYDAQGIFRTVPMTVAYTYEGAGQYDVTVLNAWNPWTDMWNRGVDSPAYNTSYFLNGNTYDFYTVLPTGTFYFNL